MSKKREKEEVLLTLSDYLNTKHLLPAQKKVILAKAKDLSNELNSSSYWDNIITSYLNH